MKEENKIVELLAESLLRADRHEELLVQLVRRADQHDELLVQLIKRADKHDEILISQGALLERHGQLLEKLVETTIDLMHGQNQTNRTLEDIKVAIKDIAKLDDRVRKLEDAVFRKAS